MTAPSAPFTWLVSASDAERFAWVVAVLEVQGRFLRGRPSQPRAPRVEIEARQPELMLVVAQLLGAKAGKKRRASGTTYCVTVGGRRAVAVMRKVRPFLGAKRRQQIDRVLVHYGTQGTARLEELDGLLCLTPSCLLATVEGDRWCAAHGGHMAVRHD